MKDAIKKVLKEHNAYWFCPVQNGMGSAGLDFHCCHYGRAFFIEAKAPGKKPTPRQLVTIKTIERSGGKVFVIDGDTSYLDKWLDRQGYQFDD